MPSHRLTGVRIQPANPFVELGERMEALAAPMTAEDGVRSFNELYMAVTRAVGAEFDEGVFEDPVFFSRLAPLFANLYFDAAMRSLPSNVRVCDRIPSGPALRQLEPGLALVRRTPVLAGRHARARHAAHVAARGTGVLERSRQATNVVTATRDWRIARRMTVGHTAGMTKQIAVKLPDGLVDELDRLVQAGAFVSRSQAIRTGIETMVARQHRQAIDQRFRDGAARLPEALEDIDEATALAISSIQEEPWERWW